MHLLGIVDNIKHEDINKVFYSTNKTYIELKNGDIYQTLNVSENSRGDKCDKVYIDARINPNIIEQIIRPMLITSELPTNEQIIYY